MKRCNGGIGVMVAPWFVEPTARVRLPYITPIYENTRASSV